MPEMSIDSFKQSVGDGLFRPNLYRVEGHIGVGIGPNDPKLEFLCKGATIPAMETGVIDLNYAGRVLGVAGDKDFPPMSITILMTEEYDIRSKFEVWSNAINAHRQNTADATTNNLEYMANDWLIHPLRRDGTVTGGNSYRIHNVWPGNVSSVDFGHGNGDAAGEFTVELNYLYWTSAEGTPGQ